MNNLLDAHGQPLNRRFSAKRLADRGIDELIGLCKGFIADGQVVQAEAEFLYQWILRNQRTINIWPVNILYERLWEMLKDGIVDDEEQKELLELLHQFTGESPVMECVENMSCSLPIDKPEPELVFERNVYCFTGKFVYGTRKQVEGEAISRGAVVKSNPTLQTDFLVIGLIGSKDWIHSTHGRKIEYAVQLKSQEHKIAIVSEEHWTNYLD